MKYSNSSSSAHPRKQQATVSSTVVRCICVTASCIVTACGLLGLGVTCFVIRLTDPSAAPCPYLLTIVVFAVAGLLLCVSFLFLIGICIRRSKMRRKALLEDLPVACIEEELKQNGGGADEDEVKDKDGEEVKEDSASIKESPGTEDSYDMTQKSADVSLWIEQQEATESTADSYHLENRDGATSHDTDGESSEPEITPL